MKTKERTIKVWLTGLSDIMFDRFYDHSKEDRPPEKKFYTDIDGNLILPKTNIHSFLFRDLPPHGAIRFVEGKKAANFLAVLKSHIIINPSQIPFLDEENKPIKFNDFNDSRFWVNDFEGGITKMSGGSIIKQEVRKRPCLKPPWNLKFEITCFSHETIKLEEKLLVYFETGGLVIGLGTHRPEYGRFAIKEWKVK